MNKVLCKLTVLFLASVLLFTNHMTAYCASIDTSEIDIPQIDISEISAIDVSAGSAIMIDADTGITVYEKNSNEALLPASTTKIMTALLLIEHVKQKANHYMWGSTLENQDLSSDDPLSLDIFDEKILFSHNAVDILRIEPQSSTIWMLEGETLTVRDALYAILLASANEVTIAIAEFVSGSEEEFTKKMTSRAKELGCTDTIFVNSHGLNFPNAYNLTTTHDLALIMREAIRHSEFVQVISTTNYTIPPTEKHGKSRSLNNSNRLIRNGEHYRDYVIGGKTGYTNEAGNTLVSYGEKDGIRLITAVMQTKMPAHYTDTIAMMDYAFDSYRTVEALTEGEYTVDFEIFAKGGEYDVAIVNAISKGTLSLLLPDSIDVSDIDKSHNMDKAISLPIEKGDVVGILTLTYENNYLGAVELVATEAVTEFTSIATAEYDESLAVSSISSIGSDNDFSSDEIYIATSANDSTFLNNNNNNNKDRSTSFYVVIFSLVVVASLVLLAIYVYATPKKNLVRSRRSRYYLSKKLFK